MNARCNWCGVYVQRGTVALTWRRDWPEDAPLGWTEPKVLCPSCAESARGWELCHAGQIEEVGQC